MVFNHRVAQGHAVRLLLVALVILSMNGIAVEGQSWDATSWTNAHATFYGGTDASGTMGGSCGYGNLYTTKYGTTTAALSVALFNNGLSCGACFQIICIYSESPTCYSGASITVSATNECPQGSYGGWCNVPSLHFDLSYPMFTKLAPASTGVVYVQYRRAYCSKTGGIYFQINGNPWFFLALVYNVGGNGDVVGTQVRGASTSWYTAKQNWGQNWEVDGQHEFVGQILDFGVTLSNAQAGQFYNVAPSNWGFGQTFETTWNW